MIHRLILSALLALFLSACGGGGGGNGGGDGIFGIKKDITKRPVLGFAVGYILPLP